MWKKENKFYGEIQNWTIMHLLYKIQSLNTLLKKNRPAAFGAKCCFVEEWIPRKKGDIWIHAEFSKQNHIKSPQRTSKIELNTESCMKPSRKGTWEYSRTSSERFFHSGSWNNSVDQECSSLKGWNTDSWGIESIQGSGSLKICLSF